MDGLKADAPDRVQLCKTRCCAPETFAPVTLGHIRSHGCRDLLVYCVSGCCHHSATLNGDWLSDDTPVRSLCSRMVCTRCGMIGADVRPDWGPHVNKRRV